VYLHYPTFEGRSQITINTCDKRIKGKYNEWNNLGFWDGIQYGKRGGEVDKRGGEKV
jgi:hypothetical protein